MADCHYLGRFQLCHVLVHQTADIPWFVLVPETDLQDILDLPEGTRNLALSEAASVSRFVKQDLGWPKVNFAAIGNLVPQLHLHVVGRRPDDPCWPAPVWGNLQQSSSYTPEQLRRLAEGVSKHRALR